MTRQWRVGVLTIAVIAATAGCQRGPSEPMAVADPTSERRLAAGPVVGFTGRYHWDVGSQTNLLFSSADEPGRLALSKQMTRYWASFARTGDPNGTPVAGAPRWEPFEVPGGRFLVFDTAAGGGVRMKSGMITTAEALAEVERVPTLTTAKHKCDVYRHFVAWAHEPSAADYPKMAAGACRSFPLAAAAR